MHCPLSCGRLAILATALFALGGTLITQADESDSAKKSVKLVIDYGDGVQKHFTSLTWRKGVTAYDVMLMARKHPRGIKFTHRGSGATAFLTKIDDLENEGRGRNWVYRVNGKLADRGFAVYSVKPGDTILWKFGKYR